MKVAVLERAKQNQAWVDQSASLDSEQVSEWSKEVQRWENDSAEPNPFEPRSTRALINRDQYIHLINNYNSDLSQADIRLQLAQEDALDLTKLRPPPGSNMSPSAMIHMGLDLEESL